MDLRAYREARAEYEADPVKYSHAEVREVLEGSEELFFSGSNMERLKESEQQFRDGQVIVKTMEELDAMENG